MADAASLDRTVGALTGTASGADWSPHARLTLQQARKRSRFIRVLRTVFLSGAVVSVAMLVGALLGSAFDGEGGVQRAVGASEIVTMLNPRFSGRDTFGRSFVLTADTAQRQRANADLVELKNPRLVDELNRVVTAPRGFYDQSTQTLELFEDVQAEEADGYVFNSTHAKFFIADNRVEGIEPLEGTGPIGDIRSDRYEILEDGASIRLKGNVRTILYPDGRPDQGDR